MFRNHENEKNTVLPRYRARPGHPHWHRGSRLLLPPDAGLADRRVDCDSAVRHRDVRDPQLHHHRQLHHPDRPADGADGQGLPPIWPMLLACTAETVIGAFAALAVIAVATCTST